MTQKFQWDDLPTRVREAILGQVDDGLGGPAYSEEELVKAKAWLSNHQSIEELFSTMCDWEGLINWGPTLLSIVETLQILEAKP